MPTISMFYGIIISMFFDIKEKHHLPHIHIRYQVYKVTRHRLPTKTLRYSRPNCRPGSFAWCKYGLIYIVKNCWQIRSLPRRVSNHSGLTRSSEGNLKETSDVARYNPRDRATGFHPASGI